VLVALSILVVGCVAVLSLFALGAHEMVQRRVEARIARVTPEVVVLVHEHLDRLKPDETPVPIKNHALSEPDYAVDVEFLPSTHGGPRFQAQATILYEGRPLWRGGVLPPMPLARSVLDPR
jgi:hypothetical protein